jgi:hypothetical protein
MKDFQQILILHHDPWSKTPQTAQKTLSQTKAFSSINPEEYVFYGFWGHQRYGHEL